MLLDAGPSDVQPLLTSGTSSFEQAVCVDSDRQDASTQADPSSVLTIEVAPCDQTSRPPSASLSPGDTPTQIEGGIVTEADRLNDSGQEQVLFHDGFDGAQLDLTQWMLPVWQSPTDGTFLGRTQLRVAQNAAPPGTSGGELHLQMDTYNPTALTPGDSFYGQEIISRLTFSRGEGLAFETRARVVLPAPGGIVYAPFLYAVIPGQNAHDEIDFELLTNEVQSGANRVQTNVYDHEPLGAGSPQFSSVPGGDLTQYHTYRTEWLPDRVLWYVDGTLIRTETVKVPDGPMSVYLNTWVPAADWAEAYDADLQPDDTAAKNRVFLFDVDYVTVRSLGNIPPGTPAGISPGDGATGMSLTPALGGSGFSDPDPTDVHAATQWQVDDNSDFSSSAWDYQDTDVDKTTEVVPAGLLSYSTTYYWRMRYQDSQGAWSEWSVPACFTTTSLPQVSVSASPLSVAEDGTTNVVFTFTRSGSTSNALTVNFDVGGTARFGTDYTQGGADNFSATFGTVTIPPGSTTGTVTIDPTTDAAVEPNVTVSLTVTGGTGYAPGVPPVASGTIKDDDDAGSDGIPATEEQGPSGDDPDYDGNADGTPDAQQDNAASFHTATNDYVTLSCSAGMSLSGVAAVANPSPASIPQAVQMSYGSFAFQVNNVSPGGSTTVTLFLPAGATANAYYKYGPTRDNPSDHWYSFMYNGQTGARISGNVVTLHFVDGTRGDDDLLPNGTIVDAGGPAVVGQPGCAPVYRFWKASDNTHFYTIKESERDKLIRDFSHIYTYEGPASYAFPAGQQPAGALPVYRFWKPSDDTHFYTIKESEKDKLIRDYPHVYTYEGPAYYGYEVGQQPVGALPVHRFWKWADNTHFFTMKESERDKLIRDYPHIYTYEGMMWYAYAGE